MHITLSIWKSNLPTKSNKASANMCDLCKYVPSAIRRKHLRFDTNQSKLIRTHFIYVHGLLPSINIFADQILFLASPPVFSAWKPMLPLIHIGLSWCTIYINILQIHIIAQRPYVLCCWAPVKWDGCRKVLKIAVEPNRHAKSLTICIFTSLLSRAFPNGAAFSVQCSQSQFHGERLQCEWNEVNRELRAYISRSILRVYQQL